MSDKLRAVAWGMLNTAQSSASPAKVVVSKGGRWRDYFAVFKHFAKLILWLFLGVVGWGLVTLIFPGLKAIDGLAGGLIGSLILLHWMYPNDTY